MKQSEEEWMRRHFPHMSNATCGVVLGKHPRTVVRMARELGLVKTDELIRESRAESLRRATEAYALRMKGTYPPNLQKWNNRKKHLYDNIDIQYNYSGED